ncbi:MAG: hypothetical protein JWM53_905 [bacterium]|nr:hypothetical protein [bacterium]
MTRLWELIRIAGRALSCRRSRSLKTMTSIGVGAFSIVLMYSLADSGLASLQHGFEEIGGTRMLFVYEKPPEHGRNKVANYDRGITARDRRSLTALPHLVAHALYAALSRQDVAGDVGRSTRADLVAADASFFDLLHLVVARGAAFDADAVEAHRKQCVVGSDVAAALFGDDAIGHHVTVGGVRCVVVGQMAPNDRWGLELGFDWQSLVVVPIGAIAEQTPSVYRDSVTILQTDDVRSNSLIAYIAGRRLEALHNGQDDFEVMDTQKDANKWDRIFLVMKLVVALLAGVALLVGGIGVMNVMLVGMNERRREIGIRRAAGARQGDIATQFIVEAMLLAGGGGLAGGAVGLIVAALAGRFLRAHNDNWVQMTSLDAFVVAVIVAAGVGLVFGVTPARRAAALDPVIAMRS